MSAQLKILRWLIDHPEWQYGNDIAEGSSTSDVLVYLRLDDLVERGFVGRREDPKEPPAEGMLRRVQYMTLVEDRRLETAREQEE